MARSMLYVDYSNLSISNLALVNPLHKVLKGDFLIIISPGVQKHCISRIRSRGRLDSTLLISSGRVLYGFDSRIVGAISRATLRT